MGYTYNADVTERTLKVRWSDGKPWTAADVVFSQQLMLENPRINGAAVSAPDAQNVFVDP